MTHWLDARAADFASGFDALLSVKREADEDVTASVRAIVAEVRARGDAALIDFSERFDNVRLTPATLRLGDKEIAEAAGACGRQALAALDFAAKRIEEYHRHQIPSDVAYTDELGTRLG